jgi:hypothetical protein
LLQVGNDTATPFTFAEDTFSSWNGIGEENCTGANYLGILAIGWCYVLSAQLVEMQGEKASMQYTDSKAGYNNEGLQYSSKVHVVDVGEVDESVARWWSAILAQNEGWKAIVRRTPRREFLAPWSVSRTCETRLSVKYRGFSSSDLTPLSSERAFEAIVGFARLHGLHSQFSIALTMALTIPTHKYYGSSFNLPLVRATDGKNPNTPIDVIPPVWVSLKEDLPYYMTLSCSPEVMMSTFCGAFWEHDIPCNLVSPWLHPILNEVLGGPSTIAGSDPGLLAFIGAIRQPNFSAFWIGAVASGLGPEILHRVRGGRPPLDPLAFPWTGCPQSFMDLSGSGPYTCGNPQYILRADVWRLMHLPSTEEDNLCYLYRPTTPWPPCGASLIKDCALRVLAHLKCARHEYKYDYWEWHLEDGTRIQDRGFAEQPTLAMPGYFSDIFDIKAQRDFEKTSLDQMASREASLDIFRWFSVGGEGLPPESIYQDDWLREIWEEDESGIGTDETDVRDLPGPIHKPADRLESWLNAVG